MVKHTQKHMASLEGTSHVTHLRLQTEVACKDHTHTLRGRPCRTTLSDTLKPTPSTEENAHLKPHSEHLVWQTLMQYFVIMLG